jgi:hypothetical protein
MDGNSPQEILITPPELCVSAIERGILQGDVCEVRRLVVEAADVACIGEVCSSAITTPADNITIARVVGEGFD